MKKKSVFNGLLARYYLKKLCLMMRLMTFMVLVSVFVANANTASSQSGKLNLTFEKASMTEVFEQLEKELNIGFLLPASVMKDNRKISLSFKNASVESILEQVLDSKDYSYEFVGKNIVITQLRSVQQNIKLTGKVTDTAGQPLPGVTVVVKGTTNGTITNFDGVYTLSDVPSNGMIQFSFVGMKMQEFAVEGKTSINVVMEEDAIGIEEVVAIGYGTTNKHAVTGAIGEADVEIYKNVPTNNILETIKGSVPGLIVEGTSSAGALPAFSIRGQNSTAGNSPLIVVDGAIFNGSIADINSSDVESFTVLKDASAAAVYGSRSANGVILIETKSGGGLNGKPKFEAKLSYGLSNEMEPLELYDGEGYIQHMFDYMEANGQTFDRSQVAIYLEPEEQKNYEATSNHQPTLEDPFGLFRQSAYNLKAEISVSNKINRTQYYIAGSFTDQKGVYLNDKFKHFTGRINIDSDLSDWINVGIKSSYSLRDYSGSTPNNLATMFSPYASVYNDDGTYKHYPQTTTSFPSPFWSIATEDVDLINNLNSVISGKVKIPWIKGLTYNLTLSNALTWTERNWFYNEFTNRGQGIKGEGQRGYDRSYNMLLDNIIRYNRIFKDYHKVDVTLLYSYEKSTWENLTGYAKGFENSVLGIYKLEDGTTQTVNTGGGETNALGIMARATYTFKNRYSLTGTVRRDGYSAFSKNKKWGVFPSLGLNWNISREDFMSDVSAINNLAMRVSYGTNGNQSINPYSTLARVNTSKYLYDGEDSYTVSQYISSFANNNLGWETTTGLNLGIDFGVLNNRINGALDVYNTTTRDLLFSLSLPKISGASSILSNVGEIDNKGIELNLNTLNIDKTNFKWRSAFSFSLNRNKIVSILGEDNDGDGVEDDLISSGYFIGESLGAIYDYEVTGIWQQEDIENGTITTGSRAGDFKITDVDGDKTITSDKDRMIVGNTKANFRWSWTNSFEYKDFSLMVYLYSVWGGNGWFLSTTNTPYNDSYANKGNINHPVYDYWTPTNTDAMFPRLDYVDWAPYRGGKKFIDRSFVKLQKVSLNYNADDLVRRWGIYGANLTLSADNLFTYAPHWVGLDPETDSGLTERSLPSIRTYTLSVSFNF